MSGYRDIGKLTKILPRNGFVLILDRNGRWLSDGPLLEFFHGGKKYPTGMSLLSLIKREEDREWLGGLSRCAGKVEKRRLLLDREKTGYAAVQCGTGPYALRRKLVFFILEEGDPDERLHIVPLLYRGVVHDLKTPLQYLRNNLTYLKERNAQLGKDPDMEDALDQSLTGTEKIDHLIRTLLDFQRVDRGERELFSLNALLDNILILVRSNWKKSVEITTDFPGDELFYRGDRFLLERAFFNIIVNSCQALEDHRTGDKGKVSLSLSQVRTGLSLVVDDNGPGMDRELRERIFESGFTTKRGGNGLGLPMARHIIEDLHGGSIKITSAPGKGTVMEIFLPETGNENTLSGR